MDTRTPWPHAPLHQLSSAGTYFVTSSTYQKQHYFRGREALAKVQHLLLSLAREHQWRLEAWSIFSNHYHFVARTEGAQETAESLRLWISRLHQNSAIWLNKRDTAQGRRVWFNYRETHLTFPKSYYARLNYTHQNAVKHGLVRVANQYPWCSAAWFERTALPSQVQTIYRFKVDQVKVPDDFEVIDDW